MIGYDSGKMKNFYIMKNAIDKIKGNGYKKIYST